MSVTQVAMASATVATMSMAMGASTGAGAVRAWEKKNGSAPVFKSGGPQDCPAVGKINWPDFRGTAAENECPAFLFCHWLDRPAPCIR